MGIYEKLLKCQLQLKAPKSQFNSFGKYKYRNCEDILESLKPLLNEYGCLVLIHDNIECINERYYIKAVVKFVDVETGESLETSAYARESEVKSGMDSSQITGASSSYARKYALNGMFLIDDTKDMDSQNNGKDSKISKTQALELTTKFKEVYGDKAIDKLKELGYPKSTEIPASKFDEIMKGLK